MTLWKGIPVAAAWLAFAGAVGLGALTAVAQDAAEPPAVEAAEPAAPAGDAAVAAPEAAAPAAEASAPEASAAAPANGGLTAKDLTIGEAVFGADGAKIGEVNRVTAESSGLVTEIHVTTGGKAGLNAEAVIVPADKIADAGDGVKLSLSAAEVQSLPAADRG